tara:strand:- start:9718 stop:10716 length:999 start_codon:yes stop_codon:yes gene_type:complete
MKIKVHEKHTSVRKPPKNATQKNINFFAHELKKEISSSHYLIEKNVFVINETLISLRKFRLFTKYTHFPSIKKFDIFKLSLKNIFKAKGSKETIKEGIWIFDDKASNYYHWLLDSLQRYILIPNKYQHFPILIPKNYENKWIIDQLNFLNLNFKIVKLNTRTKVNKILIPSYSAQTGNFNVDTLIKLRTLFLKNSEIKNTDHSPSRIWVDRVNVRRGISNKEEILKILKKYKFEILQFENYSISEVIKILSKTKVLAGPHGSGLANMLFMNKNSKVIDVREKNDNFRNALMSMASDLNLNYYCLNSSILDKENESVYLDPLSFEKDLEEILK